MATIAVTRRFDLTDEQWAALMPLLPVSKRARWPPKWTKRQLRHFRRGHLGSE